MKTKRVVSLILIISILMMCSTTMLSAETKTSRLLYPFSKDGKFSYVDIKGNKVLETIYNYGDDFLNGVALVNIAFGESEPEYIDIKGNNVKFNGTNYPGTGFREMKDGNLVDLSPKTKEYDSTNEDNMPVTVKECDLGDGFVAKKEQSTGAAKIQLFKNGKVLLTTEDWISNKEIFIIAKYDNEKMIRIQYCDYEDDCKIKTTYINYNGNELWYKPLPDVKVVIDGNMLDLKNQAIVEGYGAMVPADEVLAKLGYKVTWNAKKQELTAIKGKSKLKFTAGKRSADIGKASISLESNARVINKVLYIPINVAFNRLGARLTWDEKTKTIIILTTTVQNVKTSSNVKMTANGVKVADYLMWSKGVYLYLGFNKEDKFDIRAEEAVNTIVKSINNASAGAMSENQVAKLTSAVFSVNSTPFCNYDVEVNGNLYNISLFSKVSDNFNVYDVNASVTPVFLK